MTVTSQLDPTAWWRRIGFVGDRLALCGDLPSRTLTPALEQLAEWQAAGITDILDVREEWSDADLVADHAPEVTYHWLGTNDDGRGQAAEWYAQGVAIARRVLAHPDRRLLVHCHMGVNRGPSMAYAILLGLGEDHIAAMEQIRAARPIAATIYAPDALQWWHDEIDASPHARAADHDQLIQWMRDHPVETWWIISRIRQAEG